MKCENVVERKETILPINIDILNQLGYQNLQNAIDEYSHILNKNCKKCSSDLNINIKYGNVILIETTDGIDQKIKLYDFQNSLILNQEQYELVGIINFKRGATITSVGHYTAFVKTNEWMQFDDLYKCYSPFGYNE